MPHQACITEDRNFVCGMYVLAMWVNRRADVCFCCTCSYNNKDSIHTKWKNEISNISPFLLIFWCESASIDLSGPKWKEVFPVLAHLHAEALSLLVCCLIFVFFIVSFCYFLPHKIVSICCQAEQQTLHLKCPIHHHKDRQSETGNPFTVYPAERQHPR